MDSILNTVNDFVPDFSEVDNIYKNTDHLKFYFNCIYFMSVQIAFNKMNETQDGKEIIVKNMNNMVDDTKKCLELEQSIIKTIQILKEQKLDRFISPASDQDMIDYKKYLLDIKNVNAYIINYIELIEKFTEKKIIG